MSFICRGKLTIILKDVTKKSVSRGKKQTNEKKQTSQKAKYKEACNKMKEENCYPQKGSRKK